MSAERALLEVVLEALTLPYEIEGYDARLLERVAIARCVVEGALGEDPAGIPWNVDYLRAKLAAEEASR